MSETQILLISGPVGVGKTTVAEEVSEVLEARGIAHTYIDFDQLRYTYPRIPEDPWSNQLGLQNLGSIWKNCFARGAKNLVISTVVEEQLFIDQLMATIPGSNIQTFQLIARPDTLVSRVSKREIGSGLEWHTNRSLELLGILQQEHVPCDQLISTDDRTVIDLAEDIASRITWTT